MMEYSLLMISFKFSRPKFVYAIERGQLARRLVMVYVPFSTDNSILEGVGSGARQSDAGCRAESVARPPRDVRQRLFS